MTVWRFLQWLFRFKLHGFCFRAAAPSSLFACCRWVGGQCLEAVSQPSCRWGRERQREAS